jgi:hypothetical protein
MHHSTLGSQIFPSLTQAQRYCRMRTNTTITHMRVLSFTRLTIFRRTARMTVVFCNAALSWICRTPGRSGPTLTATTSLFERTGTPPPKKKTSTQINVLTCRHTCKRVACADGAKPLKHMHTLPPTFTTMLLSLYFFVAYPHYLLLPTIPITHQRDANQRRLP